MNLEDQVCSLELAKRLKELGVGQDSYFCWFKLKEKNDYSLSESWQIDDPVEFDEISAFTVAELGEMLPSQRCITVRYQNKTGWRCRDLFKYYPIQKAHTEADARAKMRIYLLENDLINQKE